MSGKGICLSGLAVALLGLGVAHAEGPGLSPGPQGNAIPGGPTNFASAPAPDPAGKLAAPGLVNGHGADNGGGISPAWGSEPPPYGGPDPAKLQHNSSAALGAGPGPGLGMDAGRGGPPGTSPTGAPPVAHLGISDWLVYPRSAGCCGPVGGGPIGYEVYLRTGASFVLGGTLGAELDPGWAIQGGGRVLFFTPAEDRAWTVDLGISNIAYNDGSRKHAFSLQNVLVRFTPNANAQIGQQTVIQPENLLATVGSINETFVNAAFGHEWYLLGSADCGEGGPVWRWGVDGGGLWGTMKANLADVTVVQPPLNPQPPNTGIYVRHRTDVIGGLFGSLHSDIECPCHGMIFLAGLRAEFGYVWTDVLQRQNNADLLTLNLMVNLGLRF